MINAINGAAIEIANDSITVLTLSGVEYSIEISQRTRDKFLNLSKEERESVRVFTVLQHREDSMTLFGFYDKEERYIFNELQTVPGIAARGALKILSGISIEDLMIALDRQDVKTLAKVPGIGAKTAQKLILQLRNELVLDLDQLDDKETKLSPKDELKDLASSFIELGYDRRLVQRELNTILEEHKVELEGLSQKKKEEKILPLLIKRLS